jgi:hypothetical protein
MSLKLYIIIIILLILLIFIIYYNKKKYKNDNIHNEILTDINAELNGFNIMNDILSQAGLISNNCEPSGILGNIVQKRNLDISNYYFPCSYDSCEVDAKKFEHTDRTIFLIDGCDVLASKVTLWNTLNNYYGKDAIKYMPKTFILNNNTNKDLIEHFTHNKIIYSNQIYVLKNYEQRQQGIKLTRKLKDIEDGYNNGWILVQDYIYNPYIIDKRKINFRYYLLIICNNNKMDAYVHNEGFIYYTPDYYDENDMAFNKHITTGYIDRAVYEKNPLTLGDFRKYLDNIHPSLSTKLDNSATHLMSKVVEALSTVICKNKKLNATKRFQLFGCDLAPDSNLECKLMEINKGPDMNAKDERDKIIKTKVQDDIFSIIEDNNLEATDFIKIF